MYKILYIMLFLTAFISITSAQNCGRRYRERVFNSIQLYQDVVYSRDAPKITGAALGIETTLPYDLFMDIRTPPPTDTVTKRPAFIMAFGGGFVDIAFMGSTVLVGTMDNEDVQALADTLAHWGYVTACIEYRTGFDVLSRTSILRAVWRGSQDISAGVRFLRKNSDWFGIDEDKVFIGGSSAGGFSCLHSTFIDGLERIPESYEQTPIVMQDLGEMHSRPIEMLTAFNPFAANTVIGNDVDSIANGIASYWGALGDTNWLSGNNKAPVIMFHGTNDLIVDAQCAQPFSSLILVAPTTCGSVVLDTAMRNRNISHELHTASGEGHEYWGVLNGDWLPNGPNAYWVDIINKTTDYFYNIMRPTVPNINGTNVAVYNQVYTYTVTNHIAGASYCWEVENGTILNSPQNGTTVEILWNNTGTLARVKATRIDRSEVASLQRVYNVNLVMSINVTELTTISDLNIYPNPAQNLLNIAFTSASNLDYTINLLNSLGQRVHSRQLNANIGNNNYSLDICQLKAGLYVLQMQQEGKMISKKFIVTE
jgi:acetyl esterase/lipase